MNKKSIAIIPGSFDPITNGHLDIISRASKEYNDVIVAVMINSKKDYLFDIDQRRNIATAAVAEFKNVTVISSEGMLWELAQELGANAIVKGYRDQKDYAYECEMADFNKKHFPDAETVLIKASEYLTDVSSTLVREKINVGDWCGVEKIVPPAACEEIKKILRSEN